MISCKSFATFSLFVTCLSCNTYSIEQLQPSKRQSPGYALLEAVENDDTLEAESLLNQGANVNVMNEAGVAPLTIAVLTLTWPKGHGFLLHRVTHVIASRESKLLLTRLQFY